VTSRHPRAPHPVPINQRHRLMSFTANGIERAFIRSGLDLSRNYFIISDFIPKPGLTPPSMRTIQRRRGSPSLHEGSQSRIEYKAHPAQEYRAERGCRRNQERQTHQGLVSVAGLLSSQVIWARNIGVPFNFEFLRAFIAASSVS
jgi:hypothetical protein